MRFQVKALSFAGVAIVIALLFQNCGAFDTASSTALPSDGGISTFQAGEAFDPALVPANPNNPEFLEKIASYPDATGFKTIVINADGDGLVAITNSAEVTDQEDWSRAIQERCQLQFNKPCAVLAAGDVFMVGGNDLANSYEDRFQDIPTTFDPLRIPGVINHWKQNLLNSDYFTSPNFQAYAINANGGSHRGWSTETQEEANRRALEFCESLSLGQWPCFLHTVGMTTIWDPANTEYQPGLVLFGPRPLDVSKIPLITDTFRAMVQQAYERMMAGAPDRHMIVVFARFGRGARVFEYDTPIDDAKRTAALEVCNQRVLETNPAPAG